MSYLLVDFPRFFECSHCADPQKQSLVRLNYLKGLCFGVFSAWMVSSKSDQLQSCALVLLILTSVFNETVLLELLSCCLSSCERSCNQHTQIVKGTVISIYLIHAFSFVAFAWTGVFFWCIILSVVNFI